MRKLILFVSIITVLSLPYALNASEYSISKTFSKGTFLNSKQIPAAKDTIKISSFSQSSQFLLQNEQVTISSIYPNPITEGPALIDYNLNGSDRNYKIVVHNVLGKKMAEYELLPEHNKLKISVSQFDQGVYFYSLQKDNQNISTRKIIVRK
jgi:hypothetical protein